MDRDLLRNLYLSKVALAVVAMLMLDGGPALAQSASPTPTVAQAPAASPTPTLAQSASPTPTVAQAASAAPAADLVADPCLAVTSGIPGGGGAHNTVFLHNATGGDLQVRGSVQLNQILAASVGPVNCAAALNGQTGQLTLPSPSTACTGCASLAVALQIDLVERQATREDPRNVALAQNLRCQSCGAVAVAIQYVLPVDDPTQVPSDVSSLSRSMDQELSQLQSERDLTATEAADRAIAVIQQFNELASSLDFQRSDAAN